MDDDAHVRVGHPLILQKGGNWSCGACLASSVLSLRSLVNVLVFCGTNTVTSFAAQFQLTLSSATWRIPALVILKKKNRLTVCG